MRMLLAQNIINTCENSNCKADNDIVLISTDNSAAFSNSNSSSSLSVRNFVNDNTSGDFDEITDTTDDIYHQNSSAYIAGYLAAKKKKIWL